MKKLRYAKEDYSNLKSSCAQLLKAPEFLPIFNCRATSVFGRFIKKTGVLLIRANAPRTLFHDRAAEAWIEQYRVNAAPQKEGAL
jgi:hypothetical protein